MLYIGETGISLRTRFGEHRRAVICGQESYVRPFILAITVLLIWKFSHGSNDNRKRHEMRLISKLGIVHFCSINERFPMFNSICQKADFDNTFNAYLIP
jgi:hypothetical protein